MEPNSTAGWGCSDPDPSPRELLEHAEETIRLLREAMSRAFGCLTRLDTHGPDIAETAVDAARMILAGCMDGGDIRSEAAALGFDLTDDQVDWVKMLLSHEPTAFIGSRQVGRDYALKAAVAIADARGGWS